MILNIDLMESFTIDSDNVSVGTNNYDFSFLYV